MICKSPSGPRGLPPILRITTQLWELPPIPENYPNPSGLPPNPEDLRPFPLSRSSKTSCRISFGTAKSARMAAFHENGTFFFNCQVTANIARSNKKELEARTKTRGKRGGQKKHTPRPLLNERTAKSTNAKPADLQTLFTNNKPGVLVSNLDPNTPAHILVKLFGDQGNVLNFQELFEFNSSFEKGFCSIKYETYEECQNAIRKLDNYMFNGRIISVQFEDEGEVANLNVEHQKNDKQLNYDRTHREATKVFFFQLHCTYFSEMMLFLHFLHFLISKRIYMSIKLKTFSLNYNFQS